MHWGCWSTRLERTRGKGMTVTIRQAMVERRADDAATFVERGAGSLDRGRRRSEDLMEAATSVKLTRRLCMDKIEQCKREHWVDFLINRDNIRKAFTYTKTSRASHGIPVLKANDTEVTKDREKANLLLALFFPVLLKPADRDGVSLKPRLVTRSGSSNKMPLKNKLPKLRLSEVEATIMQSKSDKAPGLDEITFRVWKKLWLVLGDVVVRLYQASLDLKVHTAKGDRRSFNVLTCQR
jgi:hypothetical protein